MNRQPQTSATGLEQRAFLGGLGAFLFALPGMLIYFLLNRYDVVIDCLGAILGGYLAVVLAIKGYSIFSQSATDKAAIKISSIVCCSMLVIVWYFSFTYDIFTILQTAYPEDNVTFFSVLSQSMYYLLQSPLILLYLMVAISFAMVATGKALGNLEKKAQPKKKETAKPKSLHHIDDEAEHPQEEKPTFITKCKSCGADFEHQDKNGFCPYCQFPYHE